MCLKRMLLLEEFTRENADIRKQDQKSGRKRRKMNIKKKYKGGNKKNNLCRICLELRMCSRSTRVCWLMRS